MSAPDGRESWMDDGVCRQTDPEAFFADRRGQSPKDAKRVCAGCDVADQCLAYALRHNETVGVWGGLTAAERRPLRRKSVAA